MGKEQLRPDGYQQRARAMKMAGLVERELQRQRNMIMNGIPVTDRLEVLFRHGRSELIQIRRKLME